MQKTDLHIVFFGTPYFAAYNLKQILDQGYKVKAVVTAMDKPAGRGLKLQESEVKKVAIENGIPVLQPKNLKSEEFQRELESYNCNLGIVIAFRMLPIKVWSMPQLGTFNLHASLLPKYRGAAPIQHAIINGEKETGVSTFFLKHEIDTGDLLLQEKVKIEEHDNAATLHDKLMETGANLVLKTLNGIVEGSLQPFAQNYNSSLPIAPKITTAFCEIFTQQGLEETLNKIRGLSPYPGAFYHSKKYGKLKIMEAKKSTIQSEEIDVFYLGKQLYFPCSDGNLEILKLQAENKKPMSAMDFINGVRNKS